MTGCWYAQNNWAGDRVIGETHDMSMTFEDLLDAYKASGGRPTSRWFEMQYIDDIDGAERAVEEAVADGFLKKTIATVTVTEGTTVVEDSSTTYEFTELGTETNIGWAADRLSPLAQEALVRAGQFQFGMYIEAPMKLKVTIGVSYKEMKAAYDELKDASFITIDVSRKYCLTWRGEDAQAQLKTAMAV